MAWGFYGRQRELQHLEEILGRGRWFFAKVMGRRRIGKTTLIREALATVGGRSVFYVQIPDSGPSGVVTEVAAASDNFGIDRSQFPQPKTLSELARWIGLLARSGYVVVLDEFQYFSRQHLREFCSMLQAVVDGLTADAENVPGGLVVLGSIHTEMAALLEDRSAPLYSRTTDEIDLGHLGIDAIAEILSEHSRATPERLLFLWNLFEGVPKFYRDCHEQGVLGADRLELIRRLFFESSSPLRYEAENWFLKELRGRYDVVLKFVASHPGCSNADIVEYIKANAPGTSEQVGGYLKVLVEKFRMVERRLPIFSTPRSRKGRYYICDNFLRSWLAALAPQVSAVNFLPLELLITRSDQRLETAEGHALERLAKNLYEERSRLGRGEFQLTRTIEGYWNRGDVELDLIALDEEGGRIRFCTCKRNAGKLLSSADQFESHVQRFLDAEARTKNWSVQKVAIAPSIDLETRRILSRRGILAEDLRDLAHLDEVE